MTNRNEKIDSRRRSPATLVMALVGAFALVGAPSAPARQALDVVVVNDAASQPVQAQAVAPAGTLTGPSNYVLYTVPAGKRLVVEHFSSEVGVASTVSVNRYLLSTAPDPGQPGIVTFSQVVAPAYHSPCGTCGGSSEEFVASQELRMYVDAGQALVVNITFSGAPGSDAFGYFAISGHLVDVP